MRDAEKDAVRLRHMLDACSIDNVFVTLLAGGFLHFLLILNPIFIKTCK